MPYVTVSSELVSELLAKTTICRDDLNSIRDRHTPSRFSGVYGHRHGGKNRFRPAINAYRARVFKFFELGSDFATAEDAARAIVAFYKVNYGERWSRIFQHRRATPWRLRSVTRNGLGGFVIDVYVRGVPVRVTSNVVTGRSPGASELDLWPTAVDAKCAARVAMKKWFERERRTLSIPAPNLLFWRA